MTKDIIKEIPTGGTMYQLAAMMVGVNMGGGAATVAPTTVTVTAANGQKSEGRLLRIDDFIVVLAGNDGQQKSFRRDGDVPKVEVHDPLEPHKKLISTYTDKDIHNVTAYLVTLK